MAAIRSAGGPRGRGSFRLTWQGGRIAQRIDAAVVEAMEQEAAEILVDLRNSIHVVTGRMRDEAFAEVEVRSGRRTLVAGSDVEYAVYEELGTSRRAGHPIIRETMDRHIPHLPTRIRTAYGRGL